MTSLTVFLPVKGDAVALRCLFADDPGRWLPESRHLGDDRWLTVVRGAGMTRAVVARVSQTWYAGSTLWRTVSWEPLVDEREPERVARYLPTMDGELGLHAEVGGNASLVLDARYHPPGGPVGVTLDTLALHRIARGTAERFLADVAAGVADVVVADPEHAGSHDALPPDHG